MGLEHPRDARHLCRVIVHHGDNKWGRGVAASMRLTFSGSLDHTAWQSPLYSRLLP
jgi:hypothetical protein